MRKLKSLEDFKENGLDLKKEFQSNVKGGLENPYSIQTRYEDTVPSDCLRWSRGDRMGVYDNWYAVYV